VFTNRELTLASNKMWDLQTLGRLNGAGFIVNGLDPDSYDPLDVPALTVNPGLFPKSTQAKPVPPPIWETGEDESLIVRTGE
jgi:hypothetical protein